MNRFIFLTLLLLLSATVIAQDKSDPFSGSKEFYLRTATSSDIYTWLTIPDSDQPAPLIVNLHMKKQDHTAFTSILQAMQSKVDSDSTGVLRMPYTLTLDLRGHGKSNRYNRKFISVENMVGKHWIDMHIDVADVTKMILADSTLNIDRQNIMIIGASIGANIAINTTSVLDNITRVALISPSLNYLGVEIEEAFLAFDKEIMIQIDRRDSRRYKEIRDLEAKKKSDNLDIKVYSVNERGLDIINKEPQAMSDLIDWIFKK